jgi:UPF0716 protein FxsA
MGKLVLLFTTLPLVELFLLLELSDVVGGWTTVMLVLASGILGAVVARAEGLRVLAQWRQTLATGSMPSDGVMSGMLLLLGCALLITPGVLTDVVAIALLLPWSRRWIAARLTERVERAIAQGNLRVVHARARAAPFGPSGRAARRSAPSVIDVEGESVEAERSHPRLDS